MSSAAPPESKAKLSADDLATLVSTLQSEMLGIKTRGNLNPVELEADLCSFTVPPAALNFAR